MAKALWEQYVAGLEALGYELDPVRRSYIYFIYKKPKSEFRFLVGRRGSLRMTSTTIERSRPVGHETKNHIVTAPERRPAVYLACNSLAAFEHLPGDPDLIVQMLRERDAGMAALPLKSLTLHVKAWIRYAAAKAEAKARRSAGADNPADSGGAAPQLPEGSPGSAGGGDLVQRFQDDPRADVRRLGR